jgi:hypothetical protein
MIRSFEFGTSKRVIVCKSYGILNGGRLQLCRGFLNNSIRHLSFSSELVEVLYPRIPFQTSEFRYYPSSVVDEPSRYPIHKFVRQVFIITPVFRLDDSVEVQALDPPRSRFAVASHSGQIRMFSISHSTSHGHALSHAQLQRLLD